MFFGAQSVRDIEHRASCAGNFTVPIVYGIHSNFDGSRLSSGRLEFEYGAGLLGAGSEHRG
jgi:hypothetical protein